MGTWQMQEAKARLSELVRCAREDGPQEITVHGETQVVVVSHADYARLTEPKPRFLDFMRSSPLADVDLEIVRDKTPVRAVKL